jgi:HK97 gp10 family phage protein
MPVEIKIEGLRELDAALQKFAGNLSEKFLLQGVSVGAKVIQDAIKAGAPVRSEGGQKRITAGHPGATRGPGFLRSRILRRRVQKQSGTTISYTIGPNRGAFYGMFVEKGHRPPHRASALRRAKARHVELGTRATAAHPFIRPALSASKNAAVDAMVQNLKGRLASYVGQCK